MAADSVGQHGALLMPCISSEMPFSKSFSAFIDPYLTHTSPLSLSLSLALSLSLSLSLSLYLYLYLFT